MTAHPHQRALEELKRPTCSTNLISIKFDPSRGDPPALTSRCSAHWKNWNQPGVEMEA